MRDTDIQSELHQKKRRFTDFIFQRVSDGDGHGGGASASDVAPSTTSIVDVNRQGRDARASSRSVSGFAGTTASSTIGGGAPTVRVTSPGAEFREGRRRRGGASGSCAGSSAGAGAAGLRTSSSRLSLRSQSQSRGPSPLRKKGSVSNFNANAANLRRFHLSRPVAANAAAAAGAGGIQKRRGGGDVGRAILVEKLARGSEGGKGELDLGGLSLKNEGLKDVDSDVSMLDDGRGVQGTTSPLASAPVPASAPARKRPVINSAEKRWREEQGAASSRAKANLTEEKEKTGTSVRDDPSNWDHGSDQLAQELQEVALEMMREEVKTSTPEKETSEYTPTYQPKPQLKYKPRNPVRRVKGAVQKREEEPDAMETDEPASAGYATGKDVTIVEEDSDGDYVYDTYIRRPLPAQDPFSERDAAAAAAASAETILQAAKMPIPIDGDQMSRNIGIVVISAEDEEYWDDYAVEEGEEEREWDSEDEDSNAEDHPFNDYPDEDLASDDEEDDPSAIYRKYRHRAASDDEQDFSEFEDEDDFGYHADDVGSDGEIRGGRGMGMGWGLR